MKKYMQALQAAEDGSLCLAGYEACLADMKRHLEKYKASRDAVGPMHKGINCFSQQ
jgi:hypothetical protein